MVQPQPWNFSTLSYANTAVQYYDGYYTFYYSVTNHGLKSATYDLALSVS